jgi:hypothetical protein
MEFSYYKVNNFFNTNLFSDVINSSDYTASKGRTKSELVNLNGRGRKKAWPNFRHYHGVQGGTEETRKRTSVKTVSLRADILNWDIPNMKRDIFSTTIFGEFLQ